VEEAVEEGEADHLVATTDLTGEADMEVTATQAEQGDILEAAGDIMEADMEVAATPAEQGDILEAAGDIMEATRDIIMEAAVDIMEGIIEDFSDTAGWDLVLVFISIPIFTDILITQIRIIIILIILIRIHLITILKRIRKCLPHHHLLLNNPRLFLILQIPTNPGPPLRMEKG
jgi:hypothetical protein